MKRNFKNKMIICFWLIVLQLIPFSGCKKIIEIEAPETTINSENVYSKDGGAIQVVTGFYTRLSYGTHITGNGSQGVGMNFYRLGLSADELTLFDSTDPVYQSYYLNSLNQNLDDANWKSLYQQIALANDALQGLESSNSLTPKVKQQLLGECKFLRAFALFYLVNLYGPVPVPLTTDFESNRLLLRTEEGKVYDQIIADLEDAKTKLNSNYLSASLLNVTSDRIRPNKLTATALLARIYLYMRAYRKADEQATEIINSGKYNLNTLDQVFKKNSSETIWSLQPVWASSNNGYNTSLGRYLILPETGPNIGRNPSFPTYLSDAVLKSFELGDARKSIWVNSISTAGGKTYHYAYKYQASRTQSVVTEYDIVFRLAEQYLIRAESRAHLGNKDGAIADLNIIRNRASAIDPASGTNLLPVLNISITDNQLFAAIEHERQTELFVEWGHRWLDMKRTSGFIDPSKTRADELMPEIAFNKNAIWKPTAKLFPIPLSEIRKNPNLQQNEGY